VTVALIAVAAVLIDWQLGEPRWFHPLIGFGHLATWVERRFYDGRGLSAARRRLRGTLAVGLLLTPAVALAMAITRLPYVSDTAAAVLLYLALGHRSLHDHARPIAAVLRAGNLDAARGRLSHIVSRDTATLNTTDIAKGAVESVLENGNDAVLAALFWFVIGGAPAVVAYCLANTLDAMLGLPQRALPPFWLGRRAPRRPPELHPGAFDGIDLCPDGRRSPCATLLEGTRHHLEEPERGSSDGRGRGQSLCAARRPGRLPRTA
jgi:cobalamin biosynthesis protein CobD/CbiB